MRLKYKTQEGKWRIHPGTIKTETPDEFIIDLPIAPLYIKKSQLIKWRVVK